MDDEQSSSTVNIQAEGGSLASGRDTVTIDQPHGMQQPEVTMSGDYSRQPTFSNVNIESSDANVSLADQKAVLVNIRPPEEAQSSTTDSLLPTDESSLPSLVSVTGGTSSGDTNLHFFVHEQGKYIQIGQCCVIVEMHVNDQTMERLKAQGTLEVESQNGASLVIVRWRGLELDEAELRTNIKVQLTEKLLDLERAIPQDLMANQCNKCQQLVTFLLREFRGYLSNISLGCIQLTLFFSNREDFQRGRSSEAISKIQKFLDGLLLTDRVNEARFKVTVLEKGDEVADPMDTTIYSRVQKKTFSENLGEPGNMTSSQPGEMLTQDQFTHRISLQVKQSITEELNLFRQEQAQILRDAMKEVLPEMEQRIIENISTKPEAGEETAPPEPDSRSGKQSTGFPIQMSPRRTPPSYQITTFPHAMTLHAFEEPDTESTEHLSGDEEISDLVSFVQSKVKISHQEVKVKQRSQPLDFSHLFNAIHERRYQDDLTNMMTMILPEQNKKYEEDFMDPENDELHKYLKEIWGKDSMKVVQQALNIADTVTRPLRLDDAEISEKFCTVLCVDLSLSMAGQPIKDQATLAAKIVQDCLGYIGLVSIGFETKVEQELTKDKDTALKVIGQLQIEHYGHSSSSPVLEGLFTALKLLQGRVKATDFGPHHTMYPKIVIISDGFFNDCSPDFEGRQPCQKTDVLLKSILEVLVAMDIKMPIYFVPVGKKQNVTHGWFSKVSVVENVDFLSESEFKEISIGRVMNAIMWPSEPETPFKSWTAVKKEFTQNLSATMLEQIEWFITEHFKHPPTIGTRVKIGKLKKHRKGTVFCHIEGINKQIAEVLIVMDSTGEILTYLWSFYQENIWFYKPPTNSDTSEFPVGTLVRKSGARSYDDLGVVFYCPSRIRFFMAEPFPPKDTDNLKVSWRSKLSIGDRSYVLNESELTHVESPLLDLSGLIVSKTVALKFSHDGRKMKELGEISHSRSRAFQSLEQKGTRERKGDQQKQGRAGIFF